MSDIRPIGISLPKEIIREIDLERGDIPRSRYLLRLLENLTNNEGTRDLIMKRNRDRDSPDRRFGTLQSSESGSS